MGLNKIIFRIILHILYLYNLYYIIYIIYNLLYIEEYIFIYTLYA